MLMTHCRPKRKLHINRERDCDCNISNRRNVGQREWRGELPRARVLGRLIRARRRRSSALQTICAVCKRSPEICRDYCNENEQREKGLSDARVKDANFVSEHGDTKAAENSLQDYAGERNQAEVAHPAPAFAAPKPARQNDREKSNG